MYELFIEPLARKAFKRIPANTQQRIRQKLTQLCQSPRQTSLDVKKLKGSDCYRLRVGDYRIIYLLEDKRLVVRVVDIGHRQSIYE